MLKQDVKTRMLQIHCKSHIASINQIGNKKQITLMHVNATTVNLKLTRPVEANTTLKLPRTTLSSE